MAPWHRKKPSGKQEEQNEGKLFDWRDKKANPGKKTLSAAPKPAYPPVKNDPTEFTPGQATSNTTSTNPFKIFKRERKTETQTAPPRTTINQPQHGDSQRLFINGQPSTSSAAPITINRTQVQILKRGEKIPDIPRAPCPGPVPEIPALPPIPKERVRRMIPPLNNPSLERVQRLQRLGGIPEVPTQDGELKSRVMEWLEKVEDDGEEVDELREEIERL
ncbi:uncharacterized protein LY89DRAFT_692355 [Mollisia scopiformis]|uniref:Uncharacterized protein n=1 Tax=Mollisia scopiformis TaxID=149040 RepID=A0A132B2A1_MOLSC|nr:uncharacterized protein LY89DRAFT_692355 [Mollisia scopiformis]KUJ06528.1 hypothetical protein LY89DRAFT_692355 [Mollisia scopiformis]